jgi:DHA2 family multidrug resistance protein-like MFS transporter
VSTVPPERAGAAAGMSEMSTELGGALGIAILGSVVTVIYRASLGDAFAGSLPASTWEEARDTLGGALAVAGGVHDGRGAALASAARSAFTAAFQAAAVASAAIALLAAIASTLVLGRPQPSLPTAPSTAHS